MFFSSRSEKKLSPRSRESGRRKSSKTPLPIEVNTITYDRLCHSRRRSRRPRSITYGSMPERLKGADCKSAGDSLRWFESGSTHFYQFYSFLAASFVGPQLRWEILWKGGRVVQCIRFENGRSLNTTGGSNPPLSLN